MAMTAITVKIMNSITMMMTVIIVHNDDDCQYYDDDVYHHAYHTDNYYTVPFQWCGLHAFVDYSKS